MIWIIVCFIPLLLPFILKKYYYHEYSWKEVAICCVVSVTIALITIYSNTYYEMADMEVLNGKVTSKQKETVSCRHSYSCRCHTVCSGSKTRSCHRSCSTCYEHNKDYDYNIYTTIGNFTINAIDRQGVKEPPRYSQVIVEDPVAKTNYYLNYVKGAKNSLFNMKRYSGDSLIGLPEYPINIYDYYKINRIVVDNTIIPDSVKYNTMLSETLKDVGNAKQVNVVLVFTKRDRLFAEKLRTKWLNGKKNDIVIIISTSTYPKIDYVEVFSWSKNPMLNISMRDDIVALKDISPTTVMPVIQHNIQKHYIRRPMGDYAYLKNSVEPSFFAIMSAFIITLVFSIVFSVFAIKKDIA